MLYLCPKCGYWLVTAGILEAIFQPTNGWQLKQTCQECGASMERVDPDNRLMIRPEMIESNTNG